MKTSEIQELIKFVSKSGVSEVEIQDKDFKIVIKTTAPKKGKMEEMQTYMQAPAQMMMQAPQQMQQVPTVATAPVTAPPKTEESDDAKYIIIKSPMIGTLYRRSTPEKPNFVNIGDDVTPKTVVCVIEAMKLFNEIEAEIGGKIVKVLVDDGSPVEYDQPLFLVDPA